MRWMSPDRSEPWRMTFPGIQRLSPPPLPAAGTTWKKTAPGETLPTAWGSHSSLCAQLVLGVKWGTRTRTGSRHSRNSWIKPYNVFSAVISVSPSILVAVLADRAPIEDDRHRQSGGRRDRQACMQTDGHTGLCCISELDSLTALWVSISEHEPCSLDPAPCVLQCPSC